MRPVYNPANCYFLLTPEHRKADHLYQITQQRPFFIVYSSGIFFFPSLKWKYTVFMTCVFHFTFIAGREFFFFFTVSWFETLKNNFLITEFSLLFNLNPPHPVNQFTPLTIDSYRFSFVTRLLKRGDFFI